MESVPAQNKRSPLYLAAAVRRGGELEESYNEEIVRGGKGAKYGQIDIGKRWALSDEMASVTLSTPLCLLSVSRETHATSE